jgi:hypothetical protein
MMLIPNRRRPVKSPARSRQIYLTGAAESSGTVGAKLHEELRNDAATIHADAASKKVTTVSDH